MVLRVGIIFLMPLEFRDSKGIRVIPESRENKV
jgi:hypothetical protein